MINSTQTPQAPVQPQRPTFAPSYNAVQINLDTPTLNAPQPGYYYDYPTADTQPYYPPVNTPPAQTPQQPKQPAVPDPVVEQKPAEQAPAPVDTKPTEQTEDKSDVDIDTVLANLSDPDFDKQALQMNEIATKGLENEAKAVPYIQEEVFNKLMDMLDVDSTKLAGPTEQQLQLRDKAAENDEAILKAQQEGKDPSTIQLPHQMTQEEVELANAITPMEQAERNKEYALFTMAVLQKTYGDEIEKRTGNVVPLTDLPGAATVVNELKTNANPAIRTAAIDALRYVNRPEYKEDLTKIYTIAQSDASDVVVAAATDALNKIDAPAEQAQA